MYLLKGGFFMYAAMNRNKELIYAQSAKDNQDYFCPICGQRLYLRQSIRQKKFFRHQGSCKSRSKIKHQESQNHQLGKQLIFENMINHSYSGRLEYQLRSLDQIADVIVLDQESLSIWEFQRSKISEPLLQKRNSNYLKITPEVYWIIDDQELKKPYSNWFKVNIHYCHQWGNYLISLDIQKACLKIYHHIPPLVSRSNFYLNYYEINPEVDWLAFLKQKKVVKNKKKDYHRPIYDRRDSIMRSPSYAFYLRRFYQEGITIHQLPRWIFSYAWDFLYFKEAGWIVMSWAYIAYQKKHNEDYLTAHLKTSVSEGLLNLQTNLSNQGEKIDEIGHILFNLFERADYHYK